MALSSKKTIELGSAEVDLNTQLFNFKYLVSTSLLDGAKESI